VEHAGRASEGGAVDYAARLALIGAGLGAGGIIAGLAGVVKALVHRREL
jgi:hypothetical protein